MEESFEGEHVYRRWLPHFQSGGALYHCTVSLRKDIILSESERQIAFDAFKFHDGSRWDLLALVVMPTLGTHLLGAPRMVSKGTWYSLESIFHSAKSFSAHRICEARGESRHIWEREYWDRKIRCEKDLAVALKYVTENPVKAGLADRPEDYQWLYVHSDAYSVCMPEFYSLYER